jgi:hypothetical protein
MKNLKENILKESYNLILEDWKLIKLATFTTIFHSLVFTIYIIYQVFFFIENINKHNSYNESSNDIFQIIISYIKVITQEKYFILLSLLLIIILLIGYFLLPPISEASLIYYLKTKKIWNAIKAGFTKFFPMFEYHWLISLFSFLAFFIVLSRIYILDILTNPFVIIVMTLWLIIIILQSILLPYVKFLIVLENLPIKDAVKKSISLALENIELTFKFVIINYLLYLKFVINIILIIWLPIFILRIISITINNLKENNFFRYLFYFTIIIGILLTTYINWIIEAFFITYWYKVYEYISNKNNWEWSQSEVR